MRYLIEYAAQPVDLKQTMKTNGDPMTCLICSGSADRIQCEGPWEERDCSVCGHYRVSDELLLMLMEQGQIFDVDKMKAWLTDRHEDGVTLSIDIYNALLVL